MKITLDLGTEVLENEEDNIFIKSYQDENGYIIEVRYRVMPTGELKISNGWVK